MADQMDAQESRLVRAYNDLTREYSTMVLQLEEARLTLSRAGYLAAYEKVVIARLRCQRARSELEFHRLSKLF